jgi:hypothetical protein
MRGELRRDDLVEIGFGGLLNQNDYPWLIV